MDVSALCFASAHELASLIRGRAVSAREVMSAHLAQMARLNPRLNAIVAKLDDRECLALADEADDRLARGERVGPLHGLPIAFKDLEAAVGFPFTKGSPIFKDFMPAEDTVIVERLRRAGAIPIGKTNVPEFGMGSHTYNPVYGTTRNPYDTSKSAGGSSGGAGSGAGVGHAADCRRRRPRRIAAQSRQFQQRRVAAADRRAGAQRADAAAAHRVSR